MLMILQSLTFLAFEGFVSLLFPLLCFIVLLSFEAVCKEKITGIYYFRRKVVWWFV
jgi:hypothetical protein